MARDLSVLPDQERTAVEAHRNVIGVLSGERYRRGIGLRTVAKESGLPLSAVAALEAGSSWPSCRTLGLVADSLGFAPVLNTSRPMSLSADPPVDPGEFQRRLRDAHDRASRVRFWHDVLCWELTWLLASSWMPQRRLATEAATARSTIGRIGRAPATGEWVAYTSIVALSAVVSAHVTVAPSSGPGDPPRSVSGA